jgi:hypothetical protein
MRHSLPIVRACRLCGGRGTTLRLVKYGKRHYAHHECYLKAHRPLADLSGWQISRFPSWLLVEHGVLEEAERLIAADNARMEARLAELRAARLARTTADTEA